MVLIVCGSIFLALCGLSFLPSVRALYAKNPPFTVMLLSLASCFLGIYAALDLSRSEERRDRMARAATLMEMTRESLSAANLEARLIDKLAATGKPNADEEEGSGRLVSSLPKELSDLLTNGAVVEQISPQSLKALLSSQAAMQGELRALVPARGRERRQRLKNFLRELAFAQGVLAAEAQFQRGNLGRKDLTEILEGWVLKKSSPSI